jgi:hypothetical protein
MERLHTTCRDLEDQMGGILQRVEAHADHLAGVEGMKKKVDHLGGLEQDVLTLLSDLERMQVLGKPTNTGAVPPRPDPALDAGGCEEHPHCLRGSGPGHSLHPNYRESDAHPSALSHSLANSDCLSSPLIFLPPVPLPNSVQQIPNTICVLRRCCPMPPSQVIYQ